MDKSRRAAPSASTVGERRAPRVRQVPAVTRAVAVLRLLAGSPGLALTPIASSTGMLPSTCLHILRVLVAEGLVQVDAAKRYSLGIGMLSLARRAMQGNDFPALVQPALDRLTTAWGVTALGVAILGLDHMVVLALSHSTSQFRLHVDVGSRFPALISATGRLVAAHSDEPRAVIEKRFGLLRWDRPPSLADWRADVGAARRAGYSIDRGNYIAGVAIVSVPVLDRDRRMTHALVALGMADALRHRQVQLLTKALRDEAAALTQQVTPPG